MYLRRLEIIGFKSFANRTILEFPKPKKNDFSITSVVGPNGSGKSNLVEAIRWALGEQSLKTLRGKKLQDVIFSGSSQKTHLNLAEVTLFFNNEDKAAPVDYKEFTITRRIYRNGESEYLINKSRVRLQDILILLAKSNFGQKSYSIVGQGLVDQILHSSPVERKKFFDEATGIKQYQIKKDEAIRKIEKSRDNLQQAGIALSEIVPRLRSLTRQINKLEKRQEIEGRLLQLKKEYYGGLWQKISQQVSFLREKIDKQAKEQNQVERGMKQVQKQSESLAYEKIGDQYEEMQKRYQKILDQKDKHLQEQSIINAQLLFEKEKNKRLEQRPETEIDREKIFSDLERIKSEQEKFLNQVEKTTQIQDLREIKELAEKIFEKIVQCLKNFEPKKDLKSSLISLEQEKNIKELEKQKENQQTEIDELDRELKKINQELGQFNEKEREKRQQLLNWQKKVQEKQSQLNELSYKINDLKIELARLETKKDVLENEIDQEMGAKGKEIITSPESGKNFKENSLEQIHKLKHELELIGSIDPEIAREYPEVHERHEFLSSQTEDLKKSIKSLNKIIQELDQKIKHQFRSNFYQINHEFDRYFKIIFGGGKAKIVLQEQEEKVQETEEESLKINSGATGIDILAVPPGKKIKNIESLSGGERALSSLALICAIIAINKPPFVVLDEVDAALDQENSFKFSKILKELRQNSQFIVVTHNQQTIEGADILYGITMGHDNISRLISLNLHKD